MTNPNATARTEIRTSVAARILGWHHNTVLKWRRQQKFVYCRRESGARQSPWLLDRNEIHLIKNAGQNRPMDAVV
jgi:hypothetical protein